MTERKIDLSKVETYSSLIEMTVRELKERLETLADYAERLRDAADEARSQLK